MYLELSKLGFSNNAIEKLKPILELGGTTEFKLGQLDTLIGDIEVAKSGLSEISEILSMVKAMNGNLSTVTFDPSLARGLSYYTGAIFEVKMQDGSIGSISGGGRYDDLTGVFGLPDVSGVGISLGVDRIYDVLEARNLFPVKVSDTTQVMLANFGEESLTVALEVLGLMRNSGISAELYPDKVKLKKQLNYANNHNIGYVILIGSEEIDSNKITLKDMRTGNQEVLSKEDAVKQIRSNN